MIEDVTVTARNKALEAVITNGSSPMAAILVRVQCNHKSSAFSIALSLRI
jgi:hypothetical protein